MALTQDQLTRLRDDIAAHPVWGTVPQNGNNAYTIAEAYNLPATPDFWVYRTALGKREIYEETSPEGTVWNWDTWMAQTATERDAWVEMFNTTVAVINPSLAQARNGINTIFKGTTGPVVAQRTHLNAMYRRLASAAEKLFVTSGAGTTSSPGLMGYEGDISMSDVEQCWAIP